MTLDAWQDGMTKLEPRSFETNVPAKADVDSWIAVVSDVIRLANVIANTDFVPAGIRGSAPATAAAMLYGREVGLPPMTALSSTHVVDGRPAINAEAMRALVFAAGHEIVVEQSDGATCKMRGRRRGSDHWTTVEWTLAMAKAADLLDKKGSNYRRYPRQMLAARATAELCRLVFPDVIHGFSAVEEFDDTSGDDLRGAEPSEDGSRAVRPVRRQGGRRTSPKPVPAPDDEPGFAGPPLPGEPDFETSAVSQSKPPAVAQSEKLRRGSQAPSAPQRDNPRTPDSRVDGRDTPVPPDVDETRSVDAGTSGTGSGDVVVATTVDPGPVDDEPPFPVEAVEVVAQPRLPIAPRMSSRAQVRMILSLFRTLGYADDRDGRLDVESTIVGRRLHSTTELSSDEASGMIDTLGRCQSRGQLDALIEHIRDVEIPTNE